MTGMRGLSPAGLALLPLAWIVVIGADVVRPRVQGLGRRIGAWPPLARLHAALGRLPAAVALPLFLVPEACSRLGWLASAWLLLHGEAWRALAVYAGTKLIAGSLALWIFAACLPSLMRVRAFAAVHAWAVQARFAAAAWIGRQGSGRFAGLVAGLRRARAADGQPAPTL